MHVIAWILTALFAIRVAGQAAQRFVPLELLPPFASFQGSSLPYGVLLGSQLVILAVMSACAWRMQVRRLKPRRVMGLVLAVSGGLYMLFSIGRIGLGLAWAGADPWFRAWIPGAFHVVLAGFVLTLSIYHLRYAAMPREAK